jgi:plasmid stabilization system protein ParE
MQSGAFPTRRRATGLQLSATSTRLRLRARTGGTFESLNPAGLPVHLPGRSFGSSATAAAASTLPAIPLGGNATIVHRHQAGFRVPHRNPRFVLRCTANADRRTAELHELVRRSESARAQAHRQLEEMLAVLQEVEAAGASLHRLPPNRLAHIHRVLRAGIRSPGGDGFFLPPMTGDRPTSGGSSLDGVDTFVNVGHGSTPALPRGLNEAEMRLLRVTIAPSCPISRVSSGGATFSPHTATTHPSTPANRPASSRRVGRRPSLRPAERAVEEEDQDKDVCAVCLSEMVGGEMVCSLACKHSFHHVCIARWLRVSVACPLCKAHALGGRVDNR